MGHMPSTECKPVPNLATCAVAGCRCPLLNRLHPQAMPGAPCGKKKEGAAAAFSVVHFCVACGTVPDSTKEGMWPSSLERCFAETCVKHSTKLVALLL